MSRRSLWFVITALAAVVAFTRLGFWQLGRLQDRRERNTQIASRRDMAPASFDQVLRDTSTARFRAVRLSGTYDYANEIIWTARSRDGAPGVGLLTPLKPDGGGPAVLVHRGWVYSPDGMMINDTLWREGDRGEITGYVEEFSSGSGRVRIGTARGVRWLAFDSIGGMMPYAIAPRLIVQQAGNGIQGTIQHPLRIDPPALDEGAHRGYALQWFAFAGITLLGTIAVLVRERQASAASRGALQPQG